jgi:glucose/arabinose dehydrogenase
MLIAGTLQASEHYDRFEILTANSPSAPRSKEWIPGDGLALEIGGMTWTSDGRLAVTIRKGEVWFIDGVSGDSVEDISYKRFASGLHEPLGILEDGDSFLVAQRTEVTRLRDVDGDDVADEYLTAASGWNVSGAYHGYVYGPERDGDGKLWITTNIDMGDHADNDAAWRGWALTLNADGSLTPQAGGMRSPSGMGTNLEGDIFYSDQQGTWMPATPINLLRKGAFYGNPSGMASQNLPGSPIRMDLDLPEDILYPEALKLIPALVPPAVWLPYNKVGRSATDIQVIDQKGAFGPFDGQLLIGEFTNAEVNRVFLEKVEGEYQGACFRFLEKFPSAVFRLTFDTDGSLYVGMTNRGWSSLGNRAYGLVRVRWNGSTPFEIKEMRAQHDGFKLILTEPVDVKTAADVNSYTMNHFTYLYSHAYGSDEWDREENAILEARVSDDHMSVYLRVDGLRLHYVHELRARGVLNKDKEPLIHSEAFYTLNRIPKIK